MELRKSHEREPSLQGALSMGGQETKKTFAKFGVKRIKSRGMEDERPSGLKVKVSSTKMRVGRAQKM